MKYNYLASWGMIVSFVLLVGSHLNAQQTDIVFYPDSAKHKINRHIYGQFAEHLGRCIYGGFWVDEGSDIPNQGRIRMDVVDAFRELSIPNLRWPGGCFADEYHWKNGIGPSETRPTMINTHWGGVTEDNSFGTHEFFELCRLLDCEPVICGNMGSGSVQEMSQWVEYMNSNNVSPMTDLRKKNGSTEPFGVRYFDVGNESWGCGGTMSPEYYLGELRRYSTFLKNYGENRLYKIACGANEDNYKWTETIMQDNVAMGRSFQGLSLHYYTRSHIEEWNYKGDAINFDENEWFSTVKNSLFMEELIQKHGAIMDKYDPQKKIGLIVDEWGNWHDRHPGSRPGFLYQQNTMRDAMVAGITLDIFNNNCDRVHMANIAQAVNVLQSMVLTQGEQLVKTPTFYVFKMYKVHQDAMLIPHKIESSVYTLGDKSVEAIHTSCSKDKDGNIHITLTNLNPNEAIEINCTFETINKLKVLKSEVITSAKMNSYNDFGKAEEINIRDLKAVKAKGNSVSLTIPSKSVVMVALREE